MAMPERIWAIPETYGIGERPMLIAFGGASERASVEYVRADIPARTVEALRDALTDVREALMKADPDVLTCTLWMHNSPAETVVDYIDAALAKIKEAT